MAWSQLIMHGGAVLAHARRLPVGPVVHQLHVLRRPVGRWPGGLRQRAPLRRRAVPSARAARGAPGRHSGHDGAHGHHHRHGAPVARHLDAADAQPHLAVRLHGQRGQHLHDHLLRRPVGAAEPQEREGRHDDDPHRAAVRHLPAHDDGVRAGAQQVARALAHGGAGAHLPDLGDRLGYRPALHLRLRHAGDHQDAVQAEHVPKPRDPAGDRHHHRPVPAAGRADGASSGRPRPRRATRSG